MAYGRDFSSGNTEKDQRGGHVRVQFKHTAADIPEPVRAGENAHNTYQLTTRDDQPYGSVEPQDSHGAEEGQRWATHAPSGPFTVSNGMYSGGKEHVDVFARSVNFSGGVRQGGHWTSDPGYGIGRAPVSDNHLGLEEQHAGAGRTFRKQQSRRIGRKV